MSPDPLHDPRSTSASTRVLASRSEGSAGRRGLEPDPRLAIRRLRTAIALLAVVFVPPLAAQPQADLFYLNLLRDGQLELERGDAHSAIRDLRLACFGLLDLPPELGACLVRLGLAQAAGDDREGFEATFTRVLEVEQRFEGYSKASLPDAVRSAFEERVAIWIAPSMIEGVPRFAGIVERRATAELLRVPEKERFRELERRAAANPEEPRWALMLAELELGRDRPERAAARLSTFPPGAAGGQVACLRAEAQARSGKCVEALAEYARCPQTAAASRPVGPRLRCLIDAARLEEAGALLADLSPAAARDPQVVKLRKDLERKLAEPGSSPPPAPPGPGAGKAAPPEGLAPSPTPAKGSAPAAAPGPAKAQPPSTTPTPARIPAPTPAPTPPRTPPASSAEVRREPVGEPVPAAAGRTSTAPVTAPLSHAEEPAAADLERLAAARDALGKAARVADLEGVLGTAREVADRYPGYLPAQELAGETAYRASNWKETVKYLARAEPSADVRPELVFYLAVARLETGDREGAQRTLRPALPRLARSPFLDGYVKRILGE